MEQAIGSAEVGAICARHGIVVHDLRSTTGSFGKRIFFINNALLLRLSAAPMAREQEQFRRVAGLRNVPHIRHVGLLERDAGPIHYTLLTLLPGDDLINVYDQTTVAQQERLGGEVAAFLDALHAIRGAHYDIGLYIPAIADYAGTWRAGHGRYWEMLQEGAAGLALQPESRRVFAQAFRFLGDHAAALDPQAGPSLLHNDFHPKNILLHQGRFSGVIDWECSQYGEADFDLCHLIHWCAYPPRPNMDLRPFLGAVLAAAPRCARVPGLARRLAIYQVEHEIQQILWSGAAAEAGRVPRLARWLEGGVEALLRDVGRGD